MAAVHVGTVTGTRPRRRQVSQTGKHAPTTHRVDCCQHRLLKALLARLVLERRGEVVGRRQQEVDGALRMCKAGGGIASLRWATPEVCKGGTARMRGAQAWRGGAAHRHAVHQGHLVGGDLDVGVACRLQGRSRKVGGPPGPNTQTCSAAHSGRAPGTAGTQPVCGRQQRLPAPPRRLGAGHRGRAQSPWGPLSARPLCPAPLPGRRGRPGGGGEGGERVVWAPPGQRVCGRTATSSSPERAPAAATQGRHAGQQRGGGPLQAAANRCPRQHAPHAWLPRTGSSPCLASCRSLVPRSASRASPCAGGWGRAGVKAGDGGTRTRAGMPRPCVAAISMPAMLQSRQRRHARCTAAGRALPGAHLDAGGHQERKGHGLARHHGVQVRQPRVGHAQAGHLTQAGGVPAAGLEGGGVRGWPEKGRCARRAGRTEGRAGSWGR